MAFRVSCRNRDYYVPGQKDRQEVHQHAGSTFLQSAGGRYSCHKAFVTPITRCLSLLASRCVQRHCKLLLLDTQPHHTTESVPASASTSSRRPTACHASHRQVAFAFVPSRETFLDRLAGGKFNDQTAADMASFVEQFGGLLAEVHQFLVSAC